ncbi:FimB/Mfa2 family fimbrial subunit [Bacteroides ovatus]|nr:FimB/Mfa2 family fimbrial subunit [Bacteroides ovatus]
MLSGILTLVLSRCIRESLEGCPLDTLLRFTYKPRGSAADLFGERVQRVRLCVYRPDGSIEHMQTLEKSELDRLQGVEMYLPQGNYTVVLWANASDAQTKLGGFSEGETIRNLSASHPHAETSASIPTLDRLLFAVTPLTVSEHETGDHTVNFSPGTIRVSLHLDGVSVQPVVHITGMESALRPVFDETSGTWRLQSVSRNKTFQPAVAYDVTNHHANATTDIPRFKADTPRHGGNYRSHHGKPYRAPDFVGRAYCPLPHTDGGRY